MTIMMIIKPEGLIPASRRRRELHETNEKKPTDELMSNPQPILELSNIHTYYGNIHALKGVSCAILPGEIACLIGANGAGKSTTLMTIFGVERAAQGEIQFKGKPIHHLRPEQVAARGVSQSPEGRQIFPKMSTLENLEMGAFLRKDKAEVANDLEGVFELFPILKDRVESTGRYVERRRTANAGHRSCDDVKTGIIAAG